MVERAWEPGDPARSPATPADPLPDAWYRPVTGKSYAVELSDDGARATIRANQGAAAFSASRSAGRGPEAWYELGEGAFAGGRFVVRASPGGGLEAELTVYGSGVPVVSSERGTLSPAKE